MSYDPTLATARDKLRFRLGDVNTAAELLPDATYTAALDAHDDDETAAALQLLDGLIALYAQMPSKTSTDAGASVEWKDRLEAWKALRTRLLADVAAATVTATVAPLTTVSVAVRAKW